MRFKVRIRQMSRTTTDSRWSDITAVTTRPIETKLKRYGALLRRRFGTILNYALFRPLESQRSRNDVWPELRNRSRNFWKTYTTHPPCSRKLCRNYTYFTYGTTRKRCRKLVESSFLIRIGLLQTLAPADRSRSRCL